MEQEETFSEYIEYFKNLSLKEKQNIVLEQLKMLAAYTNTMCTTMNIPNQILVDKELTDVKKEDYTEDDFAEAVIVYVNSIQESLNDYNIGFDKIMDNILTEENNS